MKKYTPSNPTFLSEIDVVERADLVNSQIHNLTIEQLIGNDIALKTIMEKFFGSAEKPKFAEGIKASDLVGAINEVFQLGNEKKKKLVENLVARGVPASTSDTWESLIGKVSKMSDISKDTVTAAVLLSGYTAHDAAGAKITGNLADKTGTTDYSAEASLDATNSRVKLKVPAAGKYGTGNYLYAAYNTIAALIGLTAAKVVKGNTILGIKGNDNNMDTSGGTAAAGDILSGKKAAVKGILVTGTMTNRGAWTGSTRDSSNVTIPAGYHDGKGYVSGAGAYNKGVSDADARTNADSANYKSGYSAGVSSMDGTINNLNGQIAQKDQTINNLNTQVSSLQSQIDQLNNSVGAVKSFTISGGGNGGGAGVTGVAAFYTSIPNTDGKIKTIRISNFNADGCDYHDEDVGAYISPSPLDFDSRSVHPQNGLEYRVIRENQNDSGVINVSSYPNIYVYGRSKYDSNTSGYSNFGATISTDITLN